MKHRSKLLLVSVLLVAMLVQTSMCIVAKPRNEQEMNIVEIAQQNKDLTTLVKALDSAGLVDTLKGDGPFTVFAPTDHAFKN